jgi:hypothetical protein
MYDYVDLSTLENGNILAVWGELTFNDYIMFAIINPSGGIVVSPTNADTNGSTNETSEGFYGVSLSDGGFVVKYADTVGNEKISIWNSDGSNRVPTTTYNATGTYYLSAPERFGNDNIIAVQEAVEFRFRIIDGTGNVIVSDLFSTGAPYVGTPTIARIDKLSTWTDQVAVVFKPNSTEILSSIIKSDGSVPVASQNNVILELGLNWKPVDLLALDNGTFLLQVEETPGGTDYGQNYYILDENLSVVSGPHAAFSGLLSNTQLYVRGTTTYFSSSSTSSSSTSSSSSSTSSSSTSSSSSSTSSSSSSSSSSSISSSSSFSGSSSSSSSTVAMSVEFDAAPLSTEEGRAGMTARMRLNDTLIGTGGDYIQIKCSGSKSLTVNRAFIGKASIAGNAWDYEGTPTQIFFNNGNASGSWSGSGSITSDIIPYDLDPNVAHIIAIERDDGGQNFYSSSTGKASASWFQNPGTGDAEAPTGAGATGAGKSIILEKLYTGG